MTWNSSEKCNRKRVLRFSKVELDNTWKELIAKLNFLVLHEACINSSLNVVRVALSDGAEKCCAVWNGKKTFARPFCCLLIGFYTHSFGAIAFSGDKNFRSKLKQRKEICPMLIVKWVSFRMEEVAGSKKCVRILCVKWSGSWGISSDLKAMFCKEALSVIKQWGRRQSFSVLWSLDFHRQLSDLFPFKPLFATSQVHPFSSLKFLATC